jgi:hypothetical protein
MTEPEEMKPVPPAKGSEAELPACGYLASRGRRPGLVVALSRTAPAETRRAGRRPGLY